jgi:hypothetical protein
MSSCEKILSPFSLSLFLSCAMVPKTKKKKKEVLFSLSLTKLKKKKKTRTDYSRLSLKEVGALLIHTYA